MDLTKLLETTKQLSLEYLKELPDKRVAPNPESLKDLENLAFQLPKVQQMLKKLYNF